MKICIMSECLDNVHGHGLCKKHYQADRRKAGLVATWKPKRPCKLEGCTGGVRAFDLCYKHYQRYKKYGDPLYEVKVYEHHNMYKTPEYKTWIRMKLRCYNTSTSYYAIYGGRGIKVCDRWLNSFSNFFSDMGRKPSPLHSIDRIDPDGNYEPSNCRWATDSQQVMNRRINKNNKSGYRGVYKSPYGWSCYGMYKGKSLNFGIYETLEEAAYIRDQCMMQLHGDNVRTNFVYEEEISS